MRRLRVRFQGEEIVVDDSRTNIAIGRAEENDIVVKGNLISRLHARIEFNRNKFLLIDQSTNGTFVTTREGEEAFVRRDSMQLKGEGLIGFGRGPESGSAPTVKYVCEEERSSAKTPPCGPLPQPPLNIPQLFAQFRRHALAEFVQILADGFDLVAP